MNLNTLTKKEILKRLKWRCPHGHNGIEHVKCWDKAFGVTERIGFYDIEATNLKATFGYVLSYCILSEDGKMIARTISRDDILNGKFDKNLMKQFSSDVMKFDRIIGYYSKRFDGPYLRTRCEKHGVRFPLFREVLHTDAYDTVRHKFQLHSNRLQVACDFFGIPSKGHPLNPEVWQNAQAGDVKALKFVLAHNKEDVVSLKTLWEKISKYHQYMASTL